MPTEDGYMTEAELDAASVQRRGGTIPDKPPTAEEREQQRQAAADREHQVRLNEPDRKEGVKRMTFAKNALRAGVQSGMRHGASLTDADKKRIVAGIIAELGENVPDDVQAGIRRYVDVCARAYRDGEGIEAAPLVRLTEDAAVAIANADFDLEPASSVDPLAGEMDPAKLVEGISR